MTVPEKLRMAAKLVELGVDILEAGFPIASEGDTEAVDAISREFPWANVAALARANRPDIDWLRMAESMAVAPLNGGAPPWSDGAQPRSASPRPRRPVSWPQRPVGCAAR